MPLAPGEHGVDSGSCNGYHVSYMKSGRLCIDLSLSEEQAARLEALRVRFAAACNALIPLVRQSHCWNRVTLHHAAYRDLRRAFPELGSQMVCNAIYSVSRVCRHVFQSPGSPFHRSQKSAAPLPEIRFLPTSPVFFDRHTVSIKNGMLSMFTLEGRMRFCILLAPEDEARFSREKLREIVLVRPASAFQLHFMFGEPAAAEAGCDLPEYSLILPETVDGRPLAVEAMASSPEVALRVSGPSATEPVFSFRESARFSE